MKNVGLLVWLTQLGLSVAIPPAVLILLALWLRSRFHWGVWVIIVAAVLGILLAVNGFRNSLKSMELMAKTDEKEKLPLSFNDHD